MSLSSLLFLWLNFYPFHQQQGGYFHRWFSSQGESKCQGSLLRFALVSGARKGGKCRCATKTVYSVSRLRHIALLTAAGTDGGNCWVRRFVWHHGYGSQPPLLSLGGVVRVTATRSAPPRNLSHQNTYISRHYGPRGLCLRHTPPPPPASTQILSSIWRRYSDGQQPSSGHLISLEAPDCGGVASGETFISSLPPASYRSLKTVV